MNKQILRLAIPNIISNITVPLLGLVDVGLMGHIEQPEVYIGAVALGSLIFTILYWSYSFIRMGTSGITAQSYGENSPKKCMMVLTRALFICLVGSGVLIIFQTPIEKICFWVVEGDAHIEAIARKYFYIRIYAAPGVFILYAFSGWFIGMQNSWIPMIITISVNIINIVLSYWLVFHWHLNVVGVAWGTLVAEYAGVLLAFIFLFSKYNNFLKHFSAKIFKDLKTFSQFFRVNVNIFFRSLCLITVFTFFTAKSAEAENPTILSANMILIQFLYMFSYFIDGYAYAGEALVGKYIGRRDRFNVQVAVKYLFFWGFFTSLGFTLLYLLGDKLIIGILTDDLAIRDLAEKYSLWLVFLPVLSFASFIWDGIYIGTTATKEMFITMIVATFIFFLPSYYVLYPKINNHGLWVAMLLFMVIRGIIQTIIWKKFLRKKINRYL